MACKSGHGVVKKPGLTFDPVDRKNWKDGRVFSNAGADRTIAGVWCGAG
jgi:hypothetical protein